ncbi:MAG: carboxypeptidase-like regulatory domain-containing protein [Nitrospinaceae bacterium]
MKRLWLGVFVFVISMVLAASSSFAKKAKYVEGDVSNGGTISGVVTLKGKPMPPIMEDLSKGKNFEFCKTNPDTVDGHIRPRYKVVVKDGKLKNTVVFIENIEKGKAWPAPPIAKFDFKTCDIFPKVAAVRKTPKGLKEGLVTIINDDPEILHNPHGYSIKGANRKTLFNKPLPSQGSVADVTKSLKRFKKKKDKHFFLQCDQHNFMEADARIVWNPYYSISGDDGSFKIGNIPPGKYKVTAWHPYVGKVTKEITVAGGAEAKADFELVSKVK